MALKPPFDAAKMAVELESTVKSFPFYDMDGKLHHLPNMKLIPGHQVIRLQRGDEKVLEEVNAEAFEAIKQMPSGVAEMLATAWIEWDGEEDDTGKSSGDSPLLQAAGVHSSETSQSEESAPS